MWNVTTYDPDAKTYHWGDTTPTGVVKVHFTAPERLAFVQVQHMKRSQTRVMVEQISPEQKASACRSDRRHSSGFVLRFRAWKNKSVEKEWRSRVVCSKGEHYVPLGVSPGITL